MKLSFIMSIRKQSMLLFMLLCMLNSARAQNPYWALPPNYIDFNTGTVKPLPDNPLSKTNSVGNGIFDSQGNVRFYTAENQLKNRKKQVSNIADATNELPIVPVPGECNSYFVISKAAALFPYYTSYQAYYQKNRYNPADGSSTVTAQNYFGGFSNSMFGMAATVLHNLNNLPTSWGSLFTVGTVPAVFIGEKPYGKHGIITKYSVTNKEIGISEPILDLADVDFSNTELEVSSDENYLAWGSAIEGKLYLYNLTLPSTSALSTFVINGVSGISGVEFSADLHYLFFSKKGSGVGVLDLTTLQILSNVPSTQDLGYSQLERAIDGNIYGANGTQLKGFSESAPFDGIIKTFTVHNPLSNGIYTLIDQIDNADYNKLFKSTECIPYRTLTGNINTNYYAADYVKTLNITTVPSGSSVQITGGNNVSFEPGFSVASGATFRAFTQACGTNIDNCPANTGRLEEFSADASTENEFNRNLIPIVSPNPSQGSISIDLFSSSNENIETEIIDVTGTKVMNLPQVNSLSEGANHFSVELGALPTGIYILKINGENSHHSTRVVIVQ